MHLLTWEKTCCAEEESVLSLRVPRVGGLLPFKRVFTFSPEVVHVGLEMQLEHVVLVDVLGLGGNGERVPKQRQAGEGVTVLEGGTEGGSTPARSSWSGLRSGPGCVVSATGDITRASLPASNQQTRSPWASGECQPSLGAAGSLMAVALPSLL